MSVQVPVTHDVTYLSPCPGLPTQLAAIMAVPPPVNCIAYISPFTAPDNRLPINTALPSSEKQKPTVIKLVYTITNKASITPGVSMLPAQTESCFAYCTRNIPVQGARPGVPCAKVGIWSTLSSSFMAFCALLFFAYLVDLASFIPSPMLGFCSLTSLSWSRHDAGDDNCLVHFLQCPVPTITILPYNISSSTPSACSHSSRLVRCSMMVWGASGNSVSGSDGTSTTQATQYFSATSGSALLPSLDTDTNIQSSASSGNTQLSLVNLEAHIISIVRRHLADFQGPMDEKFCDDIECVTADAIGLAFGIMQSFLKLLPHIMTTPADSTQAKMVYQQVWRVIVVVEQEMSPMSRQTSLENRKELCRAQSPQSSQMSAQDTPKSPRPQLPDQDTPKSPRSPKTSDSSLTSLESIELTTKIRKPPGEVGHPGRGGYNLEEHLRWSDDEMHKLKVCKTWQRVIHTAVKKYLDTTKSRSYQDFKAVQKVTGIVGQAMVPTTRGLRALLACYQYDPPLSQVPFIKAPAKDKKRLLTRVNCLTRTVEHVITLKFPWHGYISVVFAKTNFNNMSVDEDIIKFICLRKQQYDVAFNKDKHKVPITHDVAYLSPHTVVYRPVAVVLMLLHSASLLAALFSTHRRMNSAWQGLCFIANIPLLLHLYDYIVAYVAVMPASPILKWCTCEECVRENGRGVLMDSHYRTLPEHVLESSELASPSDALASHLVALTITDDGPNSMSRASKMWNSCEEFQQMGATADILAGPRNPISITSGITQSLHHLMNTSSFSCAPMSAQPPLSTAKAIPHDTHPQIRNVCQQTSRAMKVLSNIDSRIQRCSHLLLDGQSFTTISRELSLLHQATNDIKCRANCIVACKRVVIKTMDELESILKSRPVTPSPEDFQPVPFVADDQYCSPINHMDTIAQVTLVIGVICSIVMDVGTRAGNFIMNTLSLLLFPCLQGYQWTA
ncbi:hypothetical protein F5J12DRAFT_787355 [Pisolithus orientalis]|uniref:uncharacterized protein n=1 Tax=Pisolithus orientalis TaxID=936130 RepID=UPI0022244C49|nr:uncharacterized protein F5J12DRAFT_787355 [Pisolithus orientalis]KAI5985683.1 hypothetical protein F5J12DRAFT_787355 [Pisolithus orientalis]